MAVIEPATFPFSAVVGQDDVKLGLLLAAVDPRLGGVLLRGDKGSAKTTLARGLAALVPGGAPFVELPLGATEDRVVGTLDLSRALTGGEKRFEPGLLAGADGGILYVDEINLLPDHLVDVLLDVAASGVNRVEREGVAHTHPSRFVLIGSMNPEEGELRPQLLDRFGLAVDVRTPAEPGARAEAVRRRLDFDADATAFLAAWAGAEREVASRLIEVEPAVLPEPVLTAVSVLCAAVGAQGLRADLTICRAARALAGWEGRPEASAEDVRRVAPLALAHRARRDPFDPVGMDAAGLDRALDEALGNDPGRNGGGEGAPEPDGSGREEVAGIGHQTNATQLRAPAVAPTRPLASSPGRRAGELAEARRGRVVGARVPDGPVASVAVGATVRAAAARRASDPVSAHVGPLVKPADVREAVRRHPSANLIVLAVDASGSMGAAQRMSAAKGAVLGLLVDAYQRRDLVAMVALRGERGEVVLRPTGSVEVARARLADLPTGGRTPLAAGIAASLDLALAPARRATHRPFLVLITDGRATAGPRGQDPVEAALEAAEVVRRRGVAAVVIDAESPARGSSPGVVSLGLARRLADAMGARYVSLADLSPAALVDAVRQATR
jgi:magnesium chelatase subunit D